MKRLYTSLQGESTVQPSNTEGTWSNKKGREAQKNGQDSHMPSAKAGQIHMCAAGLQAYVEIAGS
jgi:hypothetical protein